MTVERYKIKGWEDFQTGLLISENEEWILVKHIPVDYAIDGFKIYRKSFIELRETTEKELKIAKVLGLKKIKINSPQNFKFRNLPDFLKWSQNQYGLFEFQDAVEDELFYGIISQIFDSTLIIDMIKSSGEIECNYDYEFNLNEIRCLTFESDYFESIKLLMNNIKEK